MYASKRDQLTWFKLRHRNLYVVNKDKNVVDQSCLGCRTEEESMLHLALCSHIGSHFWDILLDLMEKVENMPAEVRLLRF